MCLKHFIWHNVGLCKGACRNKQYEPEVHMPDASYGYVSDGGP